MTTTADALLETADPTQPSVRPAENAPNSLDQRPDDPMPDDLMVAPAIAPLDESFSPPLVAATAVEKPPAADAIEEMEEPYSATIDLAARDVRMVLQEQREQTQILTTKLNILFVANGALLTTLTISRLMMISSVFSIAEALGFLASFTLLVRAFLPRQVAVSPNLEDRKFLERYLALSAEEYQLQMLVNLAETYNANKQRLDDVSQTLKYAAYATLSLAVIMMMHMLLVYSGWFPTI